MKCFATFNYFGNFFSLRKAFKVLLFQFLLIFQLIYPLTLAPWKKGPISASFLALFKNAIFN